MWLIYAKQKGKRAGVSITCSYRAIFPAQCFITCSFLFLVRCFVVQNVILLSLFCAWRLIGVDDADPVEAGGSFASMVFQYIMRNLLHVINHALRSLSSGFASERRREEQGEKNTATKHWPKALLMASGYALQISVMKVWKKWNSLKHS